MVAINKRPVRLLCSPNPPRESRSLFLLRPFFFPRGAYILLPSSLFRYILSPPRAPEFPAVVISEPCEASQFAGGSISPSARKKEKSRSPFSFFASTHLVVVQLVRVIVRVNGIAESKKEERDGHRREGRGKRDRERERTTADCARSTKSILKSDIFQVG